MTTTRTKRTPFTRDEAAARIRKAIFESGGVPYSAHGYCDLAAIPFESHGQSTLKLLHDMEEAGIVRRTTNNARNNNQFALVVGKAKAAKVLSDVAAGPDLLTEIKTAPAAARAITQARHGRTNGSNGGSNADLLDLIQSQARTIDRLVERMRQ